MSETQVLTFSSVSRDRNRGLTLLEMTVALAGTIILLGSVATAVSALTRGGGEIGSRFEAYTQLQGIRRAASADILEADFESLDESGQPLWEIVDDGGGTANLLRFRIIEGFASVPGEDVVNTVYSEPIEYRVEPATRELVRRQGASSRVVARGVETVFFDVTPKGVVTVRLTIDISKKGGASRVVEFKTRPRNNLSI